MTVVVSSAKGTKLNGDSGKDDQQNTSMEDGSGQDADNEDSYRPPSPTSTIARLYLINGTGVFNVSFEAGKTSTSIYM